MPVFLSDPTSTTYLVLAAVVIVAAAVAARWQDRKRVGVFVGCLVILGLIGLIDWTCASPREEAVAGVKSIVEAVNQRDADKFAANVSDSFSAYGMKKPDLQRAVELARRFDARITPPKFDRERVEYRDGPPPAVDVVFDAWAEGPGGTVPKHVKATFVRDPDGKYRMRTFTTYNVVQKQVEEPIPGLGR